MTRFCPRINAVDVKRIKYLKSENTIVSVGVQDVVEFSGKNRFHNNRQTCIGTKILCKIASAEICENLGAVLFMHLLWVGSR